MYHPLQVFSSSLLMKTSCLRLKLVELNFLVSFNTDDQSKTNVANTVNVIIFKSYITLEYKKIKFKQATPLMIARITNKLITIFKVTYVTS